jgi:hypothetical protein
MQNERQRRAGGAAFCLSFCILHSAFCILLCGFLFFYRIADRDLWSSHEARAAMDAEGVLEGRGVLVPHLFDGQAELQKPPLYYWLVAALGRARGGVDAWAVRLPAAVSALGCVLGLAALGWICGRPRAGLLAGAVLATAVHFTWLAGAVSAGDTAGRLPRLRDGRAAQGAGRLRPPRRGRGGVPARRGGVARHLGSPGVAAAGAAARDVVGRAAGPGADAALVLGRR